MSYPQRKGIPFWLWGVVFFALGGVLGLLIFGNRPAEPDAAYRFDVRSFEETGEEDRLFEETETLPLPFDSPAAMAVDRHGAVYVAGPGAVVLMKPSGKAVRRIEIGGNPQCLALGPDGSLYVGLRDRVIPVDPRGAAEPPWESLGERAYLSSLAASEDALYAADAGNRVVLRYTLDGAVAARIGESSEETGAPGLIVPSPNVDVAFDPLGQFWVVNPGRHGLEQYRDNGQLVSAWYRPSMEPEGFCGCCNPTHIAFRADGGLVTAEKGIARVKLYGPDQVMLGMVAGARDFAAGEGGMEESLEPPIADLAVDQRDRVLVLDARRGALRIFEEKETPAP